MKPSAVVHATPQSVEPLQEAFLVSHLLSISKSIRQLVAIKLAECEVVVGQDQFLLLFEDETLPVFDIALRLSVRPSTVSKMTDILERKGWASRTADAGDARRTLVSLTAEGKRVRDEVRAVEAALDTELRTAIGENKEMVTTLADVEAVLAKRLRRLR